eukprot:1381375-Amorphochlora_amoeboformis.AAC.1
MASPLTSLRGRAPKTTPLALQMAIFHAKARDKARASLLLKNLVTPPLELPGADLVARQSRIAFRFAVEHLRRHKLIDGGARPTGVAGIVTSLHQSDNGAGALALGAMLRSGALRKCTKTFSNQTQICGTPERFRANPDASARRLMFVLCHLFFQVPLPPSTRRSQFKRSSSTVLLAPLPSKLARFVRGLDKEALDLAFASAKVYVSSIGESTSEGAQATEQPKPKPERKKPAQKLSKKERKRLEALKRLQKNNVSPIPSRPSVVQSASPALSLDKVPYGHLPLSKDSSALNANPIDPSSAGETTLLSMISSGDAGSRAVAELVGLPPCGTEGYVSAAESIETAGWGVTANFRILPVLGGGPGSEPCRRSEVLEEDGDWDGPKLNAYALDFLKHGQLGTIVKDNKVSVCIGWTCLVIIT